MFAKESLDSTGIRGNRKITTLLMDCKKNLSIKSVGKKDSSNYWVWLALTKKINKMSSRK